MNGLGISAEEVRAQTARILASRHFTGSERLAQFLRFIVEAGIDGRAGDIKEYVIGKAVYRKRDDFDPRIDSTVRVEASRLRRKLAEYYQDEGRHDTLVISVPKGAYVPALDIRAAAVAVEAPAPKRRRLPFAVIAVSGVILMTAAVMSRLLSMSSERAIPSTREVPLTSLPGTEMQPSFSPDGEAVAFVWRQERDPQSPQSFDPTARVYLVSVKGGSPRRLTKTDIGIEDAPAWSPSGDQVAVLAADSGKGSIYLVSVINGTARKILDISDLGPESLAWSPDGRLLAYSQREAGGAFAFRTLSIGDGEIRQLTTPPASISGDHQPAFSPDGQWIVFIRRVSQLNSDLYLMPASGGDTRRITNFSTDILGRAWMPDSREILFAAAAGGNYSLMRIRIDDRGVPSSPRAVAAIGGDGLYPAVIRPRGGKTELAFSSFTKNTNIWRADVTPKRAPELTRIAPSTRADYDPSFSPDGSRIAFASNRSGNLEIWVCAKDGVDPRRLTYFGGPDVGSPRWSPDGRHIAFDAQPGNNADIYVVDSDGGPVQRITSRPSDDARPSWSGDGRWIYFRSDRAGKRQIWKARYTGRSNSPEDVQQVTTGTAHEAFESADGKWVYFVRQAQVPMMKGWFQNDSGLWRVPEGGGPEEKVLDGVRSGAWALAASDIFFVQSNTSPGPRCSILVRAKQSNIAAKTVVAKIDREIDDDSTALAVSPDGRSFLLVLHSRVDSDLFLVNDFH